jgi:hypothetical protein
MQAFRLGQFVKPNAARRTSWFEGYADQAGAFYKKFRGSVQTGRSCGIL